MATRGTGGLDDTPAHMSEVLLKAERPDEVPHERQAFRLAGGRVAKTAQRAEADFAGACGSRAGVPRWGVDAPARAQRAAGDSEGRRGTPCSVARAGGSEGGARCAARATRP